MKKRIFIGLLLLGVGGLTYSFLDFRNDLHKVYRTARPYAAVWDDNADLTVVLFTDLECTNSKALNDVLSEAVAKDGNIRYIPRLLAKETDEKNRNILKLLYAAAFQEGFPPLYNKMYERWPDVTLEDLKKHAEFLGMDMAKLDSDFKRIEPEQAIDTNQRYHDMWQIGTTPYVLIATPFGGTKAIFIPADKIPTADEFVEKFKRSRAWF